jgi:cytochrome P450
LFGLSPWDRFEKSQNELRATLLQEIEKRDGSLEGRADILSLLIESRYEDGSKMDIEHLLDELGTFLFAGHETSAIAMAWAVYYLLNDTEAREKLVAELDANADKEPAEIARLPWLNAVVNESLRLNPIVGDVLRVLKEPMDLGEYRIPAGFAVAPQITLAHYNEAVFPNPERFDPSRFIDRRYSPAEYLPFGGGVRRCAGAAFALHEMAIVLATLFSKYELELQEAKPVVAKRRNVTIGPSTGIRVRIEPR